MKAILTDPEVVKALLVLAGTVISIATPVIVMYVRIATMKAAAVAGVTLNEKQQAELERATLLAVGGVEEYVQQAAKHGLRLDSNEKLEQAARIARELAQDGLKAWTDGQIKTALEAQLPAYRARLCGAPTAADE